MPQLTVAVDAVDVFCTQSESPRFFDERIAVSVALGEGYREFSRPEGEVGSPDEEFRPRWWPGAGIEQD